VLQNKEKVNIDWHSQLRAVGKEGLLLLLVLSAAFLLLSLLSYSTADPAWRQSQGSLPVSNLGGTVGAFVADVSFSLFGFMAYLLALIPMVRFLQRYKGFDVEYCLAGWLWRTSGVLLVLTSGAVLSHLYDASNVMPAGPGGAIGNTIATPLALSFGLLGATLIASFVFIIGLTISSDISWLVTLDRLGGATLDTLNWFKTKLLSLKSVVSDQAEKEEAIHKEAIIEVPPVLTSSVLLKAAEPAPPKPEVETPPVKALIKKMVPAPKAKAKQPKTEPQAAIEEDKKIKIEPFEKKSQGSVGSQGNLFDGSELPSLNLLDKQEGVQTPGYSPEQLETMSRLLES